MRWGRMNNVISPSMRRSRVVRFGATFVGPAANKQLMFERQRFCGNSADAAETEKFRNRDEQVHCQKDQVAHEWKVAIFVALRKTARRGFLCLDSRN